MCWQLEILRWKCVTDLIPHKYHMHGFSRLTDFFRTLVDTITRMGIRPFSPRCGKSPKQRLGMKVAGNGTRSEEALMHEYEM